MAPPSKTDEPSGQAHAKALRALHIGDLHFWSFRVPPRALLGKRVLGVGNLAWKRARAFRTHLAAHLASRAASLAPDYALFSGDFSTTSLPAEFRDARECLAALDAAVPGRAFAVPGNHDRYTRRELRRGRAAYDDAFADWAPGTRSPWFRELGGGLVLAGIDPTTSNGLGSHGRITPRIAERLNAWADRHGGRARELWLLCHFPAEDAPGLVHKDRGPQLLGADLLLAWIRRLSVPTLFLHGHHHHRWIFSSDASPGLAYLNAGAPLLRRRRGEDPDLGFHQLIRRGGRTEIEMHWRGADGAWRARPVERPAPGEAIDLQHPEA